MNTNFKTFVSVLAGTHIDKPLSYASDRKLPLGHLVRVPVGNRIVTGVLNSEPAQTDTTFELKAIESYLPEEYSLTRETLDLLLWCQRYYHCAIGKIVLTALPTGLLGKKLTLHKPVLYWHSNPEQDIDAGMTKRQQQLQQWLHTNGAATTKELLQAGFTRHLIGKLSSHQVIIAAESRITKQAEGPSEAHPKTLSSSALNLKLTDAQANALQQIFKKPDAHQVFLLDGVTGSGKTEVYIRAIEKIARQERQALLLVPEIGLINQTLDRFRDRLNYPVFGYHSDMTDTERVAVWKAARQETPAVFVGTRSSIFLPLINPGMILVDEEQDSSYKQAEGFRYHARDLAVVRAKKLGIPLILGSATPSIESLKNAELGNYQCLQLPYRAGKALLPNWRICSQPSTPGTVFTNEVMELIADELDHNNQVLVFLNRRGYAPRLQCQSCGWSDQCPACDRHRTLHHNPTTLICHHCDRRQRPPSRCPQCQSSRIGTLGTGTQQLEQRLSASFPQIECIRVDRDSTQRKGSFNRKLESLKSGQPALLIGTQMITKGHHLPGITLVVVLDVDSALFSLDFRAQEHLAQSLVQVAGRAGRGTEPGTMILQTGYPEHPFLQRLKTDQYHEIAADILQDRCRAILPPFQYSAMIRADSTDLDLLIRFSERCYQVLKNSTGNRLLGPMPAPVEKRNRRYRYQLFLSSTSRKYLHQALATLESRAAEWKGFGKVRWGIDVDPVTMD